MQPRDGDAKFRYAFRLYDEDGAQIAENLDHAPMLVEPEVKLMRTITHFDVERALLTERQKPGRDGERSNRTVNRIIERANVIFTLAVAECFIEGRRNPMNKIAKLEDVPNVKRRLDH